ncbi:MAG TPA: serine/threonine-protein kinase [Ktedonobacteraceae bacterium]|nr:serine/threonine-protein kinase [Ktedonobacteraceae bacterium]
MVNDLNGKNFGNYTLIKELGRGTFGSVYLGRHLLLETKPFVAVKVLHANLRSQAEYELFFREARLLDKLTHPHILPILDAGHFQGYPFFVVEYAPGGSLRDRLIQQNSAPIALDKALQWLHQIGQALQFAHDHDVVHRDLKPENILFNFKGEATLADFSIATELHRTRNAYQMGTPPYMAPEQFLGSLSKRSDQYALGCVAYEMLTGQRPFKGADFYSVAYMHVHEQPQPPSQLNPSLPAPIEQAILRAMAKNRDERYVDVEAFVNTLLLGATVQRNEPSRVPKRILTTENVALLSLAWSSKIGGGISAAPVVVNDIIYASSSDHHLYAMEAASGQLRWATKTNDIVSSSPTIVDDMVYIGSSDHRLYALDTYTGAQRWVASTTGYITSSPVVANGIVYVGSWDYHLYALDARDGTQQWVARAGNAISSSPTVMDGLVYVGARDDKLYAFNAASGAPRWVFTTKGIITSSPAVANGIVYAGSWDRRLYAFDALTGNMLWSVATRGSISSAPVVVDNIVYVGSDDHVLYAVDAVNGKLRWSVATGGAISASPMVVNGMVFVGSGDGKIYAFDALNGHPFWMGVVGVAINVMPALANGIVYVGADDGKLYAFALPD